MKEIIFYNGFNLLVDFILIVVTAFISCRIAYRQGWITGYGEGEYDSNFHFSKGGK